MKKISLDIFGTTDFRGVLDVLAPSDALVRKFWRACAAAGLTDKE